jgi:hypothetical protein
MPYDFLRYESQCTITSLSMNDTIKKKIQETTKASIYVHHLAIHSNASIDRHMAY